MRRVDAMRERLAHRREILETETDLDAAGEEVRVVVEPRPRGYDSDRTHPVPYGVRAAADWSWRLLVIVAGLALVGWLAYRMRVVVFPIVAAALLAALLRTPVHRLRAAGWNRAASAVVVFVGFLVVVAGSLTVVGRAVGDQFGEVANQAEEGLQEIQDWLARPPFSLSAEQLQEWIDRAVAELGQNQEAITEGALSTATLAVEVLTGLVLTLFSLVFFLYDGDRIWAWLVRLFPRVARPRVDGAGKLAWRTLTQYVRGTVLVALFDGTLITILLLILGVPLALPLGVLVFFGAFVPLVGAFVTGALAVLVALVANGLVAALIVLAGIIAIQQLEGHVFQPFVLGRMVRVHPLAVVIAVAVGAYTAGIIGAVVAVPIVAVANTVLTYLLTGATVPSSAPPPRPDDLPPERAAPPRRR
ncbi:MAG TPA: AI-2E family transporter [Jiangellaceae bacterium]|nr:AI-2E family transporter [Jiangellaceae bacterium]